MCTRTCTCPCFEGEVGSVGSDRELSFTLGLRQVLYIHIYMYICIQVHVYIYIYTLFLSTYLPIYTSS